jgi:hypothetical protein
MEPTPHGLVAGALFASEPSYLKSPVIEILNVTQSRRGLDPSTWVAQGFSQRRKFILSAAYSSAL